MSIVYPTHTVVVLTLVLIAIEAALWFALSETVRTQPLSTSSKRLIRWGAALILTLVFMGWKLLSLNPPNGPVLTAPYIILFDVIILVAGLAPLFFWSAYRRLVSGIPVLWLVAIHILRIEGGYFLTLLDAKMLPPTFALEAGYGDILVAVVAAGVTYFILTKRPGIRTFLIVWNVLGFLDFFSAQTLGGVQIPEFTRQLVNAGAQVGYLNDVLIIPAVGVPILALVALYTLFQLATGLNLKTAPSA